MLNTQDIQNILLLISRPTTTIQADEVQGVAMLQLKLRQMLEQAAAPEEETSGKGDNRSITINNTTTHAAPPKAKKRPAKASKSS